MSEPEVGRMCGLHGKTECWAGCPLFVQADGFSGCALALLSEHAPAFGTALRCKLETATVDSLPCPTCTALGEEVEQLRRGHRLCEECNSAGRRLVEDIATATTRAESAERALAAARKALEEISVNLPCDEPCIPIDTTCSECGCARFKWCAGGVARGGLGEKS